MKKTLLYLMCTFLILAGCNSTKSPNSSEKIYSAQQHIDIGKQYMKEKKFSNAKASFIEAIKLDVQNADAYGFAGTASKYNGDYDQAINYFKNVIFLEPNEIRAHGNIGEISKKLKKYDEAIKAFQKVLEINPNEYRALDNLAEIYYKINDYKNCQIYLNKFDAAISKINPVLLSERKKQEIERAKGRHLNYKLALGSKEKTILDDIKVIISTGDYSFQEAIRTKIENDPDTTLSLLLEKIESPSLPEKDLTVYIWALGLTKSPKAAEYIIKLSSKKQSEMVVGSSYAALAAIGSDKSGKYLFEKLNETSDPMKRYNLLSLLAQLKYKPAIPLSAEVLKLNPKQYYWQSIFIFGKYGDLAIPFLLKKTNDSDKNIRGNAIMLLGQWLVATEAKNIIEKQYWKEEDPEIRTLILSSLEKISNNLDDIKTFSQKVLIKETDETVIKFAKETINNHEQLKNIIKTFKSKRNDNRAIFNSEYTKIMSSLGKNGDYKNLKYSSAKADEKKLKRLKEIILQRNSDECFYDYQKINGIITLNRFL